MRYPVKFGAVFLFWALSLPVVSAQSALSEYVKVLRGGEDPVEYVFRLFETSDIVILGERDHRDVTQYEFISKLIADPRFAERIGHVYTEVGVTNLTRRANDLIKGKYGSWEEYRKARLDYLRDEDYSFGWEKTNRSMFIDSLYSINSRLPDGKKITLGLTDVKFDWHKAVSPTKYRKWYYKINFGKRDKIMADNFIRLYKRQKPIEGNRKALVITNEPHAANNPWRGEYGSEGFRIKKNLGEGKVKIVCLNWYDIDDDHHVLVDDGRWDASFELTGCRAVGFDIAGTVFGQTVYSLWGVDAKEGRAWQDFADGVIYYKPFYEFQSSMGIEGFVADSCREEQQRRLDLLKNAGVYRDNDWESNKEYYNTVGTFPCTEEDDLDKMKAQMGKWLDK